MIITQEFGEAAGHPFRGNQYTDGITENERVKDSPFERALSGLPSDFSTHALHGNMDPEHIQSVQRVVDAMHAQAPTFMSHVKFTVGQFDALKVRGVFAGTRTHPMQGSQIDFNPAYATDWQATRRDLNFAVADRQLVTKDFEGVVYHEIGHAAVDQLAYAGLIDVAEPGKGVQFDRLTETLHEIGIDGPRSSLSDEENDQRLLKIADQLSLYATTTPSEFIGEAYAQYKTAEQPSEYAMKVGQWIDAKLTEYEAQAPTERLRSGVVHWYGPPPEAEAASAEFGDLPGHPFRGNQYTDGEGSGGGEPSMLRVSKLPETWSTSRNIDERRAYGAPIAKSLYQRAVAVEAKTTPVLRTIAERYGAKLVGAPKEVQPNDPFTKTPESILTKIAEKSLNKDPPLSVDEAATRIADTVRYTLVAPSTELRNTAEAAINGLETNGFRQREIENYFTPGDDYNGINAVFHAPDGTPIEIQMHTPESLALKDLTHEDYKISQDPKRPPEERQAAYLRMVQTADKFEPPPGILDIGQLKMKRVPLSVTQLSEMTAT